MSEAMRRRNFLYGLVALVAAKPAIEALSKDLREQVDKKAKEYDAAEASGSALATQTMTMIMWCG